MLRWKGASKSPSAGQLGSEDNLYGGGEPGIGGLLGAVRSMYAGTGEAGIGSSKDEV
jgi:hypothetical protein